jgi:hypothetical protein
MHKTVYQISMSNDVLNVRVELRGIQKEKFLAIQSYLGIESATEVVRFLVNDFYRENLEKKAIEANSKKVSEKPAEPEITREVIIE